jgi:hypothetical protein
MMCSPLKQASIRRGSFPSKAFIILKELKLGLPAPNPPSVKVDGLLIPQLKDRTWKGPGELMPSTDAMYRMVSAVADATKMKKAITGIAKRANFKGSSSQRTSLSKER